MLIVNEGGLLGVLWPRETEKPCRACGRTVSGTSEHKSCTMVMDEKNMVKGPIYITILLELALLAPVTEQQAWPGRNANTLWGRLVR